MLLIRLPAALPTGEERLLLGTWESTERRAGESFTGFLRERPRLLLRGLGERVPTPGSSFAGRVLVLPWATSEKSEGRLINWLAARSETSARDASRRAGPEWRRRVALAFCAPYPEETRPLARALLLGDRVSVPRRLKRQFRDAGFAHLLALSGLHIGLLLLLGRKLLLGVGVRIDRAEWVLLMLLPLFPFLLGDGSSITRAVAMAAYVIAIRRFGGRPVPGEALAAAACIEIMRDPMAPAGVAFQLSYLATFALISRFGGRGGRGSLGRPRWMRWLVDAWDVSWTCTIATLPIVLLTWGRCVPLSPLWNLLTGPLCALCLLVGWLTLPLGQLPSGELWVLPAAWLLELFKEVARLAGERWDWVLWARALPVWIWIPWSIGCRSMLLKRPLLALDSPLLAIVPMLFCLPSPMA